MKREKEILRRYLESLSRNQLKMEPNEASSSMCRIYDSLHGGIHNSSNLIPFVLANFFVSLAVLVINLCRRKPG